MMYAEDENEQLQDDHIEKVMSNFKHSMLKELGDEALQELLPLVYRDTISQGMPIFEEGQRVVALYILERGTVRLKVPGEPPSQVNAERRLPILDLTTYLSFGACRDRSVYHSCEADAFPGDCKVMVIHDADVKAHTKWGSLMKMVHFAAGMDVLSNVRLFKHSWWQDEKKRLAECIQPEVVTTGTVIAAPGQRAGGLTIIMHGKVRSRTFEKHKMISVGDARLTATQGAKVKDMVLGVREMCNDRGYDTQVDAISKCMLVWKLSENDCADKVPGYSLRRLTEIATVSTTLPQAIAFSQLKYNDPRLRYVVEKSPIEVFWKEHQVVAADEPANAVLIVCEGELSVTLSNGTELPRLVACASKDKVHICGEIACLETGFLRREATLKVVSESATVMWISPKVVCDVFGSVDHLLRVQNITLDMVERKIREKAGVFKLTKDSLDVKCDTCPPLKSTANLYDAQDDDEYSREQAAIAQALAAKHNNWTGKPLPVS